MWEYLASHPFIEKYHSYPLETVLRKCMIWHTIILIWKLC